MREKVLKEYVDCLKENGLLSRCDLQRDVQNQIVKYVSYNSMDVKPGTLFICKGAAFKQEYLHDAIEKGAICYIAEKKMIDDFPVILASDIRKAISDVSALYFDQIWNDKLQMIGLTGTKGKSTTVTFIKAIIDDYCQANGKTLCGFLSGIYNYDGEKKYRNSRMTTPETIELHSQLAKCADNGCEYLVMETSSQGLKYHRTKALKYKIGCLLNIGIDHISSAEHPDMDDYIDSKMMIFGQSEIACINNDMEKDYIIKAKDAAKNCKNIVTYSIKCDADYRCIKADIKVDRIDFEVEFKGQRQSLSLNMGGGHNLSNAVAAIAITDSIGIPFEHIRAGLKNSKVAGRMEIYKLPNKRTEVVVDYAHNQLSYQSLIKSVKEIHPGWKVLFLFSCVGKKAFNRRKEVGEIASREADKIIITEDNCFGEDFANIRDDIMKHISEDKDVEVIYDRAQAVRRALEVSGDDWVVLLTGYGIDDYKNLKGTTENTMTDGGIVEEYIKIHS